MYRLKLAHLNSVRGIFIAYKHQFLVAKLNWFYFIYLGFKAVGLLVSNINKETPYRRAVYPNINLCIPIVQVEKIIKDYIKSGGN